MTDGGLRDVHEVRRLGFGYFARYVVVSHGNFGVVDVGEPVTLDGQEVRTGDILHGDANGIVIVPRQVLDGLPEAVRGGSHAGAGDDGLHQQPRVHSRGGTQAGGARRLRGSHWFSAGGC